MRDIQRRGSEQSPEAAPETATEGPQGVRRPAGGARDAQKSDRPSGGRTENRTHTEPKEHPVSDLHLIISRPEPGEWLDRLDVVEALEAAGWMGDEDMPLSILRHESGAVWAVVGGTGDSGLDCPGGASVSFPADTPSVVILAACLAAAADAEAVQR